MDTKEAINALLSRHGYDVNNVDWIGAHDGHLAMTMPAFLARFGHRLSQVDELVNDLVITLYDGNWFELEAGGGQQRWVLKTRPQRIPTAVAFDTYEITSSLDHQSLDDVNHHTPA